MFFKCLVLIVVPVPDPSRYVSKKSGVTPQRFFGVGRRFYVFMTCSETWRCKAKLLRALLVSAVRAEQFGV